MIKLYKFLLLTLLFNILPSQSASAQALLIEPPCSNSVCISHEMIAVAHNLEVVFDPMPSYFPELSHEEDCINPRETGIIVQKQIPRRIVQFPDSLCTNQGCAPSGDITGAICE